MDSKGYLEQYGWKQGEALKRGGIKKPILVKHKKDKKGIGHQPNGSADAWWERLFDGQLKGLDVTQDSANGISFKQDKVVASAVKKQDSPLYRMFVRGETLQGTSGKVILTKSTIKEDGTNSIIDTVKTSFNDPSNKSNSLESIPSDSSVDKKSKKDKIDRKMKKEKNEKKEKKNKRDSKDKVEKKNSKSSTVNPDKKVKKDKKEKKDKKSCKIPSENMTPKSPNGEEKIKSKDQGKAKDKKSKDELKDSSKSKKKRKLDDNKSDLSKNKKLKA